MTDLSGLSAGELLRLYEAREVSPSEVIEESLKAIGDRDGEIGAFRAVLAERATAEADARTREIFEGGNLPPLHGIPVAVKELIDVEGAPASYGSRVLAGRMAVRDAEAVRRLRRAGAIVVGTTCSHEFGWGITTQYEGGGGTRNPWNLDRVPGGSSGGSAACVASGMVPVALGSDTGGSIRIPASYCGVSGLKPTYGAISGRGVVPLAPSLDHVGALARSVEDLGRLWSVLRDPVLEGIGRGPIDHPPGDAGPERLQGWRVGIASSLVVPDLDPDYMVAFEAALSVLSAAGCQIVEVDLGSVAHIRKTFATIQMAEASNVHRVRLGTYPSRADQYGSDVRSRLEAAAEVSLDDYLTARIDAAEISATFREAMQGVDALLSPVAAGGPSTISDPDVVDHLGSKIAFRDLVMNFTTPQDLTGLPACSVAVGLDHEGLPIGLQLTAAHHREDVALFFAAVLQAAFPMPAGPKWNINHIQAGQDTLAASSSPTAKD